MSTGFDYARAFNFDSLPLAIAGTILSLLFTAATTFHALKPSSPGVRTIYLYFVSWSVLRTVGFGLRTACLVGANNQNVVLCANALVFSSIGFIPLLKVLIMNVLSCYKFLLPHLPPAFFSRVQKATTLAFLACTALIIAYMNLYMPKLPAPISPRETAMRDVAYWGLVVLTVAPTVGAVVLAMRGVDALKRPALVLTLQGLLLTLKMGFALYQMDHNGPNSEAYFYALSYLPELLYMVAYVHPTFAEEFASLGAGGDGNGGKGSRDAERGDVERQK
ncbi:hypothetical protein HDU98_009162 [Podochytrium sp. JEL0797]|nr:hypothetical protein HDU98_009162 [Podochytrium sp. JEL0797]